MAVTSNLPLGALFALYLVGCAGNVLEGLPRDGGDNGSLDPVGEVGDGSVRRDGAINGGVDASRPSQPTKDAAPPEEMDPEDEEDASSPAPRNDAATPSGDDAGASAGTALNGGALARPSNGREFTSDATKWAGAARCKLDQVAFCDDFESQAVGGGAGPAWTFYGKAATTTDDQAQRGTKSMRFDIPAGMPGQMQEVQTFPLLKDRIFGRFFVRFSSPPTAPSNARWTLVEVGGSDNKAQVRLGGEIDPARGGKNFFGVGSDGGETLDWHTKGLEPQSEIAERTWYCVEFMFDGNANETRVWINNVEQLSLHTTAANYQPGDVEGGKQFIHPTYEYLKIGWWVYQADATPTPNVTFIDELILDDEQIGCSL